MQPAYLPMTLGAMVLGVVLLFFTITRLVRLVRGSVVARVPVVTAQTVSFERPGAYALNLEGPRFSTTFRRATFSLRDTAGGREVPSSMILFRTTTSGYSTVRISVRRFAVERAGHYALSVTGIEPDADTAKHALVFTRPYGVAMVLLILGIVLGGFCLIGGLVFTALQFAGRLG